MSATLTDTASGRRFYYTPGCAGLPEGLRQRIRGAELLFMDGTTWINEEMAQAGVGEKTSQRMGHMAIADPGGTLEACRDLDIARKVFIHINNTNPVLLEDSPERGQANAAGWTVAYDGMEVELIPQKNFHARDLHAGFAVMVANESTDSEAGPFHQAIQEEYHLWRENMRKDFQKQVGAK